MGQSQCKPVADFYQNYQDQISVEQKGNPNFEGIEYKASYTDKKYFKQWCVECQDQFSLFNRPEIIIEKGGQIHRFKIPHGTKTKVTSDGYFVDQANNIKVKLPIPPSESSN